MNEHKQQEHKKKGKRSRVQIEERERGGEAEQNMFCADINNQNHMMSVSPANCVIKSKCQKYKQQQLKNKKLKMRRGEEGTMVTDK